MAIRVWNGTFAGEEGNWNEGHNWDDENGSDAGVIPVATDDVYFTTGSQDVTVTPATSVVLASLNFGTKWTGSTTVNILMDATTLDYANKVGTVKLEGTYTTATVQATNTENPALTFVDGCSVVTLRITGGNGTILFEDSSAITGTIEMIGSKGCRLELEDGVTVSAADLIINDGRFISYNAIDTITQFGGTVEMRDNTGTTNTITMYQGNCKYMPTGATTLTTLTMYGGFFDMRGSTSSGHTITNTTVQTGAMIDERNGLQNTTYTNPISCNGIIKCDLGREVTVT